MKTTVELPDDLFRRAKATAASQRISFKQFFVRAVQERLRSDGARPVQPAWKKLAGQLKPLREETRRIQKRIDEDDA